jgi:hypothetical protein
MERRLPGACAGLTSRHQSGARGGAEWDARGCRPGPGGWWHDFNHGPSLPSPAHSASVRTSHAIRGARLPMQAALQGALAVPLPCCRRPCKGHWPFTALLPRHRPLAPTGSSAAGPPPGRRWPRNGVKYAQTPLSRSGPGRRGPAAAGRRASHACDVGGRARRGQGAPSHTVGGRRVTPPWRAAGRSQAGLDGFLAALAGPSGGRRGRGTSGRSRPKCGSRRDTRASGGLAGPS